jgi:hypothetical protein
MTTLETRNTSIKTNNDHGVAATRAGMEEAAVREPPARLAGVDARVPWFFPANPL